MAEQIKFKFELDSDEAFDILKDIGEAENIIFADSKAYVFLRAEAENESV